MIIMLKKVYENSGGLSNGGHGLSIVKIPVVYAYLRPPRSRTSVFRIVVLENVEADVSLSIASSSTKTKRAQRAGNKNDGFRHGAMHSPSTGDSAG